MGMKRRYLAVLMGIMVATTSVPAMVYAEDSKTETAADAANDESGEADASDENGDESQENVVLGEVKSVSDSEITIAVGTMKEMGQPGGDGQNGGAPDGNGQGGPGNGQPGGQSQGVDSYTAVNEYTEDTTVSNETIESTGTDENAALISSGASVTLDNDTITRTSEDSKGGDNSSFYGVGAAVLATDGTAYVKDSSVTTDAAGGAGLFAYGDGSVYASGTTVKTTQDTSGSVHVAGGGTLYG